MLSLDLVSKVVQSIVLVLDSCLSCIDNIFNLGSVLVHSQLALAIESLHLIGVISSSLSQHSLSLDLFALSFFLLHLEFSQNLIFLVIFLDDFLSLAIFSVWMSTC